MKFRKILVSAISLMTIALLSINIMPISAFESGDVSEDGNIDSYDALMILNYSVSVVELSDSQLKCADINNDGVVDSYDALLVLRYIVGDNEIDYSMYIGDYVGLFGDERTESYTAYGIVDKEDKLEITSFKMSITSFDREKIDGSIILESGDFSREMKFSEMQTVEFNNDYLHLSHKGGLAEIDMDIKFDSSVCSGKINKAKITSIYYDFPCDIFFSKV